MPSIDITELTALGTATSTDILVAGNIDQIAGQRFAKIAFQGNAKYRLDGVGAWNIGVPVGAVFAFIGGSFADGNNNTFTNRIGNDVTAVNTLLSPWYKVCNGAALNDASSPIFNGPGRYLPNLTDDRFLQGDLAAGVYGGNNSSSHTHTVSGHSHTTGSLALTESQIPSHTHTCRWSDAIWVQSGTSNWLVQPKSGDPYYATTYTAATGSGATHNHGNTSWLGTQTTSVPSSTENRPKFLTCIYIMRVRP